MRRFKPITSPFAVLLALGLLWLAPAVPRPVLAEDDAIGAAVMADIRLVLGTAIGTPVSEVERAVMAAGYERVQLCSLRAPGGEQTSILLSADPVSGHCNIGDENKPVVRIYYSSMSGRTSTAPPEALIAWLNGEIGAEASCAANRDSNPQCAWHTPAGHPDAQIISIDYLPGSSFKLTKENLNWPSPPVRVELSAGTPFDPLAPIGDMDVLAPGGVAIGMPLEQAHAGLSAAGFQSGGYGFDNAGCEWLLHRAFEVSIKVQVTQTTGGAGCKAGAVIAALYYEKTDLRRAAFEAARPTAETAARIRERLGAPPEACTDYSIAAGGRASECTVQSPPKAPGLADAWIRYSVTPGSSPGVALAVSLRAAPAQDAPP